MSQELIDQICQILAERQELPMKQVLVIIFGCNHNEEEVLRLLKKLRKTCRFTILSSKQRLETVGAKAWQELGEVVAPYQLLEEDRMAEFETVLVPFLTRNSLAKTVYGMTDTGPLTLLQHAFLMGKEVLISNHGYQLDTDYAVFRGLDQNPFLLQQINDQEKQLEKMGAKVGDLQAFKGLVENTCGVPTPPKTHRSVADRSQQTKKRIITQQDLQKQPDLEIPAGAILTDLAKEQIKKIRGNLDA